jgi:hypothetical protein
MAGKHTGQDGLRRKLHDVGSRLGWFDEPIDDILSKVFLTILVMII